MANCITLTQKSNIHKNNHKEEAEAKAKEEQEEEKKIKNVEPIQSLEEIHQNITILSITQSYTTRQQNISTTIHLPLNQTIIKD